MKQKVNRKVLFAALVCFSVFLVMLLTLGIFEWIVAARAGRPDIMGAGRRWSSDGARYAVTVLYTEEGSAVSSREAESWAMSISSGLLEASVTPKEGARSFAYSYGTETTLRVTGPRSSVNAAAVVGGGDFFVFHPLSFTYGSGFLNDPSNPNGVVLDRDLAWKLFGSENIVGFEVTIGNEEFVVTGISEKTGGDEAYLAAYGDTPRMYLSAAGYEKLTGNEYYVTTFEAALPNAVRGFAWNIFTNVVPSDGSTSVRIEVTDRASLSNRFETMKTLDTSFARMNTIKYPYWEKQARVYDYRAAVMMIWEILFAAVGLSALLASLILLRLSGWSFLAPFRKLAGKAGAKREKRRAAKASGRKGKPSDSQYDDDALELVPPFETEEERGTE